MSLDFWHSDLGVITGSQDDAFIKSFSAIIPDNTLALAKIIGAANDEYNGVKTIKIEWELVDGEYKGARTFQKIKAFDADPKKRHTALNMLKLIFDLARIDPAHNRAPNDVELSLLIYCFAGLKIQEWSLIKQNGEESSGNFISEVHNPKDFVSVSGKAKEKMRPLPRAQGVESAFSRNIPANLSADLNDDIPF